jgi:hypothetical protein
MPTRSDDDERRTSRPLLKALFWAGVGLAPIAIGLLLLADGNGPLRIAAVLAVVCVVLIGLSIALRGDADSVRLGVEGAIADEIDSLHQDVRKDITSAAQQTHRALSEQIQALQQQLEALRAQVDGGRSSPPRHASAPAAPSTYATPSAYAAAAQAYASIPSQYAPPSAQTYGSRQGSGQTYKSDWQAEPRRAGGVFHTETFQVTTSRHTYAEGNVYASRSEGSLYGASPEGNLYGGGRYTPAPEPAEESWTDQRLRELRVGERRASTYSDGGNEVHVEDRWASVRQEDPYDSWSESTSWPLNSGSSPPALPQRPADPAPTWRTDPAAAWGEGWGEREPAYDSSGYELPRAGRRATEPSDERWR